MAASHTGSFHMKILDDIPFKLDPDEVFKRLHLNAESQYASEVNALIESARQLARPRAAYKAAFVQDKETDAVVIAEAGRDFEHSPGHCSGAHPSSSLHSCCSARTGAEVTQGRFVSRVLRNNLDEVERVFPYVVTCGRELDSMPVAADDVFAQFCRDAIKEMAMWSGISYLYEHLQETYALDTLASMNPGSGDINVWPIEQQKELFAFLGNVRESIGVDLTETCLMVPNKSVSGIFYPSEDGFESCQLCRQERCPERRAPFDTHLWEKTFGETP